MRSPVKFHEYRYAAWGYVGGAFYSPITLSQTKREENPRTPVNGFVSSQLHCGS